MIRILLACGIGASSGFMAAGMRKKAKERGLDVSVKAVSKSEVEDHIGEFDVLMLGPHFKQEVPKWQAELEPNGIKVSSIDPDDYASLNGEGVLEDAMNIYNGSKKD
jgi:PTS system cellobiose-specific IIB component